MMIRHLQDKYNASSDPAEREAYYGTLAKMRGYASHDPRPIRRHMWQTYSSPRTRESPRLRWAAPSRRR